MSTNTGTLLPVNYDAPLVNPSPAGLYGVTAWTDETGPTRWLADGVLIRPHNYGGEAAFGVWGADWCALPADLGPDDIKDGERPSVGDPFDAITVWAYDACDPSAPSQAEVRERVQQNLRLLEQVAVEREFAGRAKVDAGTAISVGDLVEAVGNLEAALAKTNTAGLIHASPAYAAVAARYGLIQRSGTGLRTPLGHQWVFGGGYVDGLGSTLVATSPTVGWRDAVAVRDAFDPNAAGEYAAIAERSVVVGYEHAIGAVKIAAVTP